MLALRYPPLQERERSCLFQRPKESKRDDVRAAYRPSSFFAAAFTALGVVSFWNCAHSSFDRSL